MAHNDKIDQNLIAAAKRELEEHDPELLVLQLLAVDQNGHVRGTYYPEYVERIEITDRLIEEFLQLVRGQHGYLDDQTAVVLMADHGQGRGIGAHGHLSEGERYVPFAMWGSGIRRGAGRRRIPPPSWTWRRPSATCSASNRREGSTGRVLKDALEKLVKPARGRRPGQRRRGDHRRAPGPRRHRNACRATGCELSWWTTVLRRPLPPR